MTLPLATVHSHAEVQLITAMLLMVYGHGVHQASFHARHQVCALRSNTHLDAVLCKDAITAALTATLAHAIHLDLHGVIAQNKCAMTGKLFAADAQIYKIHMAILKLQSVVARPQHAAANANLEQQDARQQIAITSKLAAITIQMFVMNGVVML